MFTVRSKWFSCAIEILLLMLIVAFIVAIVLQTIPRRRGSPDLTTETRMRRLIQDAWLFKQDNNRWPEAKELSEFRGGLRVDEGKWYFGKDGWGRAIEYKLVDGSPVVFSHGPDLKSHDDDLIRSEVDVFGNTE